MSGCSPSWVQNVGSAKVVSWVSPDRVECQESQSIKEVGMSYVNCQKNENRSLEEKREEKRKEKGKGKKGREGKR